jgi:hypothetical protein
MRHSTRDLFSESAYGMLAPTMPWSAPSASADDAPSASANAEPPSYVETLGFPRGTPPLEVAQVIEDIRDTAPGARVEQLLRPGKLSRLFSMSAAEASYALSILAVAESPEVDAILARLRTC